MLPYPTDSGNYNFKKNQCCTFKFNLKIKQNIKHYYSTVSLKFCFNDEKFITPVKGLNPGVFFWRRLLLKLTTCTYDKNVYNVSLTICCHIFSMLFTTNWTPSIIMLILLILFYYCQSKITHLHVTGLYSFPF